MGKRKDLFFLNEVCLIYNVVLLSAVQPSDSVIHIYTLFLMFFPLCPRRLGIAPCAIQWDLVVYPF